MLCLRFFAAISRLAFSLFGTRDPRVRQFQQYGLVLCIGPACHSPALGRVLTKSLRIIHRSLEPIVSRWRGNRQTTGKVPDQKCASNGTILPDFDFVLIFAAHTCGQDGWHRRSSIGITPLNACGSRATRTTPRKRTCCCRWPSTGANWRNASKQKNKRDRIDLIQESAKRFLVVPETANILIKCQTSLHEPARHRRVQPTARDAVCILS
jgi:hypothetical protein